MENLIRSGMGAAWSHTEGAGFAAQPSVATKNETLSHAHSLCSLEAAEGAEVNREERNT